MPEQPLVLTAELIAQYYEELRRIARKREFQAGGTLSNTDLVNEACCKLLRTSGKKERVFQTKKEFISFAAETMKNLMKDYIKAKKTQKRNATAETIQELQQRWPSSLDEQEYNPESIIEFFMVFSHLDNQGEADIHRDSIEVAHLSQALGLGDEEISEILEIDEEMVEAAKASWRQHILDIKRKAQR